MILLLLLLAAAVAAYTDPSVPPVDKLWNGVNAPMQAVALYPLAKGIDLGCVATVSSPPSAWTFEALVYQLPGPLSYEYVIGESGKSFFSFFEAGRSKHTYVVNNVFYDYFDNQRQPGWKHVAASYDGSTVRIWFNGRLVHQISASGVSAPTVIRIFLYGASDLRRVPPLIVAWVKLWSGVASQDVHVDQLARGVAPPGLSLVAGIDYTRWPPATLAGTWDCNGKLFGVPVTRVSGAYVDTAWSEPYSPGRLFGFGWTGSASIAYAHTPTSGVSSWWSITAILSTAVSQSPWIGVGNAGQYGGGVVRTDADNLYATPHGAYAGVLTWVANNGIYYNGTKVASTASNNGIWAPWWWGLRRGAAPSGVSGRAVVSYVWVSNATSTAMPPEAIMVDYRWWPPVSSVGFFGTWAHPAYQVSGAPALVPGSATGVVSSNTDTWVGGASTLLPPVPVVAYNGATNNTGLHFGAAYIWRVISGVSAPGRPIALVPSTYTLTGWAWSGPTPNTGLSVSLASGQSVTLYALATAPGAYTFTIGGSVSVSVKVSQGYDTLCTLSGSGTCNLPPGVSLISITATATAATTFTVRITYAPPSGSFSALRAMRLGSPPLFHHVYVVNGRVDGRTHFGRFDAPVMPATTCVNKTDVFNGYGYAGVFDCVDLGMGVLATSAPGKYAAHLPTRSVYTTAGDKIFYAGDGAVVAAPPGVSALSVLLPNGTQAHLANNTLYFGTAPAAKMPQDSATAVALVGVPLGSMASQWWSDGTNIYIRAVGYVAHRATNISSFPGTPISVPFSCTGPQGRYVLALMQGSVFVYALEASFGASGPTVGTFRAPGPGWYKLVAYEGLKPVWQRDVYVDPSSTIYCDVFVVEKQAKVVTPISLDRPVVPIPPISITPLAPGPAMVPFVLALVLVAAYYMTRELSTALLVAAPVAIAVGAATAYPPFVATGVVLAAVGVWLKLRRTT